MNAIFQQVRDWVRGTLGEVEITAEPPQNASDTVTVSIYFKNMDISPAVGVSRRFRQRRNVDFPEPDGPMTTTTSPF